MNANYLYAAYEAIDAIYNQMLAEAEDSAHPISAEFRAQFDKISALRAQAAHNCIAR